MTGRLARITPCLWFESQAEEAAAFYTSIFKPSRIVDTTRYGAERHPIDGIETGSVMSVKFELDGHGFLALNGGPQFKFNEAVSLMVNCDTQEEVDYYWERLSEGGDEKAQVCGWLKDKYGVSWQVVPSGLQEMLSDPDPVKTDRVTKAMLRMKKMDIRALQEAYRGGPDTFDLALNRTFEASAEELWAAWTEAEMVRQWWGPGRFTCPLAEMDVREGGMSLVCMRAPAEFGGMDLYNTWTYTRIVPQTRMEYILKFTDRDANLLHPRQLGLPEGIPDEVRHAVTFEKLEGNRTKVTVEEFGYTTEHARNTSAEGMHACLDKLASLFGGK